MAAHHLLGGENDGNLVLLAGPDYARILDLVLASGLRYKKAEGLASKADIAPLKEDISRTGQSVVVIASMPEVEGRLDRFSFERNLIDLAFAADRVVYAGKRAAVLIWPEAQGTRRSLVGGHMSVTQHLDVVGKGQTVVGMQADSL